MPLLKTRCFTWAFQAMLMQLGGEAGYTYKRLSMQAEYIHSITPLLKINDSLVDERERSFYSYYANVSYFIKGSQRRYNHRGNRFSSLSMDRLTDGKTLSGTIEIAARYSKINLRESIREVKMMSDITQGLNYYLNSGSRLMFN